MAKTVRFEMRFDAEFHEFLKFAAERNRQTASEFIRAACRGTRDWGAWIRQQERGRIVEERRALIAARAAAKPQRERIFDIKRRDDVVWECRWFQEPNGMRVMADWGAPYTWEEMIDRIRMSYRNGLAVQCTDPEAHDRELRTLLATRERVYREADVELPGLEPGLVKPAIPRCAHWVKLSDDCTKCDADARMEAVMADIEAGVDIMGGLRPETSENME